MLQRSTNLPPNMGEELGLQGWYITRDRFTKEVISFACLHHCAGASSMLMTYVLAVLDFFRIEKR